MRTMSLTVNTMAVNMMAGKCDSGHMRWQAMT